MYLTMSNYANYGRMLLSEVKDSSFAPIYKSYERAAESVLNWYTFNRLKGDIDNLTTDDKESVFSCMAELIDLIAIKQQASTLGNNLDGSGNAAVISQSNDGVSVSFNALNASQIVENYSNETRQTITFYLSDVKNSKGQKVLYKGLYAGE